VIAKAIGQLWANLSSDEKAKYQNQAVREKEDFIKTALESKEVGNDKSPKTDEDMDSTSNPTFVLPVARIRKICRLDPDVRNISKEAVLLVTKSAEYFTAKLAKETANVAHMQNRKTVLPEHVATVCSLKDPFKHWCIKARASFWLECKKPELVLRAW